MPSIDPNGFVLTSLVEDGFLVYQHTCRPDPPEGLAEREFEFNFELVVEPDTPVDATIRRVDIAIGRALADKYLECIDQPVYVHQLKTKRPDEDVVTTDCVRDGEPKVCVKSDGVIVANMVIQDEAQRRLLSERQLDTESDFVEQFRQDIRTALEGLSLQFSFIEALSVGNIADVSTASGGGSSSATGAVIAGAAGGLVLVGLLVFAGMRTRRKSEMKYYEDAVDNMNSDDEDSEAQEIYPVHYVNDESVIGDSVFNPGGIVDVDNDEDDGSREEGLRFVSTGTPQIATPEREMRATLRELGPGPVPRNTNPSYRVDDTIDL